MGAVAAAVRHVVKQLLANDRLLVVEAESLGVGVGGSLVIWSSLRPPAAVHDEKEDEHESNARHAATDVWQVLHDVEGGGQHELDAGVVGPDLVVHTATVLAVVLLCGPADP